MRATFSAGIIRSFSPAESSVASICGRAVEIHCTSSRLEEFWKARTATDLRDVAAGTATGPARGISRWKSQSREPLQLKASTSAKKSKGTKNKNHDAARNLLTAGGGSGSGSDIFTASSAIRTSLACW